MLCVICRMNVEHQLLLLCRVCVELDFPFASSFSTFFFSFAFLDSHTPRLTLGHTHTHKLTLTNNTSNRFTERVHNNKPIWRGQKKKKVNHEIYLSKFESRDEEPTDQTHYKSTIKNGSFVYFFFYSSTRSAYIFVGLLPAYTNFHK